ncbi:MAG: TRAP transporter TatT component family protein [Acidiferrobacterales bacterium]|jgi:hypothetical protein|nr:TRAP transporter TatT component family protein [Acidiferrobacterales bacterium]
MLLHLRVSGTLLRLFVVIVAIAMTGCSSIMSSTTGRLANNLSSGILNQDDPQTVADGAPAYLILIDGFIEENPNYPYLLFAGAKLYGAYGSVFVEDPNRRLNMSDKAFDYAARGLCLRRSFTCGMEKLPYDAFIERLKLVKKGEVDALYSYATSWAGWIEPRAQDWNAVADLAKVKAAMQHVIALDEGYDNGGAHFYLAVLESLLPAAMGGKPELARQHFERAIVLSGGKNLMVKVYFAERYARMKFDRPLHDRLLKEVIEADPKAKDYTLSNTLAQRRAHKLLNSADEYF